ncbi:hypothetical protein BRADI_1g44262v3 [Brachypodium distachyon]|uniref:RING-type domain-containing protein n=3 Tax=Brachypodium distachyon TaxID=15368 RepID=A0A2K2DPA5_BRADI|nr:hypothetical protein BRADI_1g44262v3 [Brachypodium distachyon]PNT76111.1 hypothetical protein BRADI_1g44262v3 [Brachypodium distachyon]
MGTSLPPQARRPRKVLMKLFIVEVFSFASQLVEYFVIIGVIAAVFYFFLKQLSQCSDGEHETVQDQHTSSSETEPILTNKKVVMGYGAMEEQPESSMCSASAEDLYSESVCKICYDAARSCFFIPCGHGFTCFTCARRIMEDENKTCPICRRLVHRVRRLEIP